MTTRCKFHCQSVRKFVGWGHDKVLVHEAEFTAVTSGSEENKQFFAATPTGSLKIGTYKEDVFQPGKDYYLDIFEADHELAKESP